MSDKPLLLLGVSAPAQRQTGLPRPIPRPRFPNRQRQTERMGPSFQRLRNVVDGYRSDMTIQSSPTDLAPDRAIVFEVAGSLSGFATQAERVGFKFLGELESEFDPDEDFYFQRDLNKSISARLYLVMPDLRAMEEMLSLWNRYSDGEVFERGFGQWKSLFSQLHSLRPWGVEDRVTDSFVESMQIWLESETEQPFRFEVDLWFSNSEVHREQAKQDVLLILDQVEGQVLHESSIPAIRYHGLLAEISKESMSQYETPSSIPLADLDSIMCLNPQAMAVCDSPEVLGTIEDELVAGNVEGTPVAAMLDGFPMVNHSCLLGKVEVYDFLGIEGECPAGDRHHGTGMASLIVNGDLNDTGDSEISSKLLILPVLSPDQSDPDRLEKTPTTQLAIDVIYRAVLHLKQGVGGEEAIGEQVVVINHSIADRSNSYAGRISPWARLLDYLSFTYNVLFIVSAGNYTHSLPLLSCERLSDYEDVDSEQKFLYYHKALAEDMRNRQVLSPAEALNPISVGAWHRDNCTNSTPIPSRFLDVLPDNDGPSIISAVGLGHKRSIKPDLFYDGGRVLTQLMPNGSNCALWPMTTSSRFTGQAVAAPSSLGEINNITNICGTSNAAALITRKAIQIIEMLNSLEEEYEDSSISSSHRAVLVKALLAHGCKWDIATSVLLDNLIEPVDRRKHQQRRTNIARLQGFGRPDIERVLECTSQRATMIGQGTLSVDKEHYFQIPLPDSLAGRKEVRRLTVTVAWMSPTNPRDLEYRQAVLDADIGFGDCGTKRLAASQAPGNTVKRGTLLHAVYQGSAARNFDDDLTLRITCREQAGRLDDEVAYAVAVSFEVEESSGIDVYEEIRNKLPIHLREPVTV